MTGEKSRFISDRRVPSNSSWVDDSDWSEGVAEDVEVVGGQLVGHAPIQVGEAPDSVVHHYDASALEYGNLDTIGTWPDLAGGADLTADGGYRPTFVTDGIGGNPSVEFDGSQTISSAPFTDPLSQPISVIIVVRRENFDQVEDVFNGEPIGNRFLIQFREESELLYNFGDYQAGGDGTGDVQILSVVASGYGSFLRKNGSLELNGNGGENELAGVVLAGSEGYLPMEGQIAEVLVYNKALSLSQLQNEETRLQNKWSI